MANDGQIVFQVTADGKHAISDIKEITRVIEKETQNWDDAAKESTDNINNSFGSMLKKIAAGISAAAIGKMLVQIGSEAISLASDLHEVQNVVDVTFGEEGASKIESWAKKAGTQFGLTETQAKKFSSTMGAMLKSSGMAGDEILTVSTDLAGLAADMASFYNLDFEESFSKIRSGMSGMTMPLKELGIDMSVANLNAFALQKGLSKTFDQMSQSEQTMLRYEYLMQATADAQGDFARTSDEYANGMRQLETNLTSIKTKLGDVLLDVVNPLVAGINALFSDETKSKTVLDEFSSIDQDTENKLAKITAAANDARDLTKILDDIVTKDKGKAFEDLANGANKLTNASVSNWNGILRSLTSINGLETLFGSDSNADQNITDLANALSGATVDTTKAEAWKTFLGALSENADAVSKLTGSSVEETKTWLETLGTAAGSLKEEDADAWNTLLTSFVSGIDFNTPAGQQFRNALSEQFLAMGSDSEEAAAGLKALGYGTDDITDKQRLWLETCKKLVNTIPGLNEIINTETGEIKGGTQAISDYVDEWERTQKKLIYWKAYYSKQAAQSELNDSLYSLQIEAGGAEYAVKRQMERLDKLRDELGISQEGYEIIVKLNAVGGQGDLTANEEQWNEEVRQLGELRGKAKKALENYNQAVSDNSEAIDKNNLEYEWLIENVGELTEEEQKAIKTTNGMSKAEDGLNEKLGTTAEALKEIGDYYEGVQDKVQSSVDGIVKGFDAIETPMQKNAKNAEKIKEQITQLDSKSKTYTEDLAKLNDELNKYTGEQVSAQSMRRNLEQQSKYMDDYLTNLEKAREKGASNEVLAQLADGSEESFDMLAALAEATPEEVKAINEEWNKVSEKKKELSEELTQQQLTVDEVYQGLLEEAKKAVDELDLQEEAKDNAGKTVQGVVQGISENVGGVKDAVDEVIKQVERLEGLGVTITYGENGAIFNKINPFKIPGFASGADYIPADNFLARLHEGEAVLTAEENKVWQGFKRSSAGVDYDQLGGVVRDNVKPGGNVYLDGKIVGSVISDRQGKSFKSLQRSGWQQ